MIDWLIDWMHYTVLNPVLVVSAISLVVCSAWWRARTFFYFLPCSADYDLFRTQNLEFETWNLRLRLLTIFRKMTWSHALNMVNIIKVLLKKIPTGERTMDCHIKINDKKRRWKILKGCNSARSSCSAQQGILRRQCLWCGSMTGGQRARAT